MAETLKELNSESYDFGCAICELLGGDAMIEGKPERHACLSFACHLPRFNGERRAAAVRETIEQMGY